jgi:hypothetical protein
MARFNPVLFDTANPLYAGATVTIYTVNGSGQATTTLATIYDATTGAGTLANPQTLNSEGRFAAPVYLAEPVIMTISGPVTTHSTGIQAPSVRNRGTWATATLYAEGDIVRDGAAGANTGNTYLCEVRHTSGTWATDLAAVRWSLLTDLSTQTAAAAASAAAALASEIAAAASAASISLPIPIASGGTGAIDAADALAALGAQPVDSDLTAIAGLTTQPFGRSLLTQADAAAARTTLGITASSGSEIVTAGENLSDRDLIYQDVFNQRGGGADRWYEVDTDATSPVRISPRLGIALAAITSGNTGSAQVRAGRVSGFTSLTVGQPVFASATAGAVTQTAPTIPGTGTQNATRLIGYAASATEIDFDPEDDTIFTARNSSIAVDGTITVQHWTDAGAREREQAAYLVQASASALVAGGTGTNLGDFTVNGGLAAIFDGTTNQDGGTAGVKLTTTSGHAGKTYSSGKRIAQAVVWGGNSANGANGYVASINPTVTLVLRGKTGSAPSSRTDGTSLGSISFTDTTDESGNPRTIASSDTATVWDHVWIDFSHNGAANTCVIAEIQFTELTGAARDEPLTIGGSLANAAATDRVIVRYDDGSGANADTRTTFINRTNATRDMAAEVVL